MGHNIVISGSPKFTGIPKVDRLSMGPSSFGASHYHLSQASRAKSMADMMPIYDMSWNLSHLTHF